MRHEINDYEAPREEVNWDYIISNPGLYQLADGITGISDYVFLSLAELDQIICFDTPVELGAIGVYDADDSSWGRHKYLRSTKSVTLYP